MKNFLNASNNIPRDSYIWNMAGSLLLAFQSVIILTILTRIMGLEQAGIFTLAYANANLFFNIGKYGMRYFQASDPQEEYSFSDYLGSRIFTSCIMIVVSITYIIYTAIQNNYNYTKTFICILVCMLKLVDVIEDVFYGRYQQKGRMDIAAKTMTIRVALTTFFWGFFLFITKNLIISTILTLLVSIVLLVILLCWTYPRFGEQNLSINRKNIQKLLKNCFPLFLGSFLALYISNAPKYSIDVLLNDEIQACYGFISMPVMVISLLNGMVFNPMISQLSVMWMNKEYRLFGKKILRQICIISIITLVCIAGAYLIGIPVLSIIYGTDLRNYKRELIILLFGGGLLGLSGLLNTIITVIRFQKSVMLGYIIVALLALVFSNPIVETYQVLGASILYVILMGSLCICFTIFLFIGILKRKN